MLVYLLFIIVVCFYQSKIFTGGRWNTDYLSMEQTSCVKGVFLLFVFAAHYLQYVRIDSIWDKPYLLINDFLGQGIVTMFLFYSGYGICESIQKKGIAYVKQFPRRRILTTVYHFWMAVLIFLFIDILIGKKYAGSTILLSFTGWTSIGNSNWYMFAIFWCYLFTWFVFGVLKREKQQAVWRVTLSVIGYILVMQWIRPEERWWYNTILVYPAGMWFSLYKKELEERLGIGQKAETLIKTRGQKLIYPILAVSAIGGTILLRIFTHNLLIYLSWALLFTGTVLLLTMKVALKNPFLKWMGQHTFEVYIMQRLPMILLKYFKINRGYPYLFGIVSFILLIVLAMGFHWLLEMIDKGVNKIFER